MVQIIEAPISAFPERKDGPVTLLLAVRRQSLVHNSQISNEGEIQVIIVK